MMQRSKIHELLSRETAGEVVLVQGWVRTKRSSKTVSFLQVNDGSTLGDLQIVVDQDLPDHALIDSLNTGCSISVEGTLVESPGKGQRYEIAATRLEVAGLADPEEYPLQKKRHTLEFLRDMAHLRPRTNTFGAMARVSMVASNRFFMTNISSSKHRNSDALDHSSFRTVTNSNAESRNVDSSSRGTTLSQSCGGWFGRRSSV